MIKALIIALLIAAPILNAPASGQPPAAIQSMKIESAHVMRTAGGLRYEEAVVVADIINNSTAPIDWMALQVDVVDGLRQRVADRLFIKLYDYRLGDGSLKPGDTKRYRVPIRDFHAPSNCGSDGYSCIYLGSECLANLKINIIKFKDGSQWEREGWRNQPSPNY